MKACPTRLSTEEPVLDPGIESVLLTVRGLLKSIPAVIILAACVAVASRLEALGVGGALVTLAMIFILVFVAAMVWAYFLPWIRSEFIVSLLPIPIAVLLIVSYYSGLTGPDLFDGFNLAWTAQISLGLGIPWVAGTAAGSYMIRRKPG